MAAAEPDGGHEGDDDLGGGLDGGRDPVTVILVAHDPAWAERFQAERTRIIEAVGEVARAVEHIGSTSVPGLAAKPIVDILVTVPDVGDEVRYARQLEGAGYELRVREPDHRMFRTAERDVHVHVYRDGHDEVAKYRRLRDRLRADEGDRIRYEQVKKDLSRRSWRDMNDYAGAKTEVIQEILGRAPELPESGV